jgi:hypothetical protein
MPKDINHPINKDKIDERINIQCNDEAKELARIFSKSTKNIGRLL